MQVWVVEFLRDVGDADLDSIWSTEAKAKEYLKTKKTPGWWNGPYEATLDVGSKMDEVNVR
jgi:hypothetical protein